VLQVRPVRRSAQRGQLLRDAGRQVLLRDVPGRGGAPSADGRSGGRRRRGPGAEIGAAAVSGQQPQGAVRDAGRRRLHGRREGVEEGAAADHAEDGRTDGGGGGGGRGLQSAVGGADRV